MLSLVKPWKTLLEEVGKLYFSVFLSHHLCFSQTLVKNDMETAVEPGDPLKSLPALSFHASKSFQPLTLSFNVPITKQQMSYYFHHL